MLQHFTSAGVNVFLRTPQSPQQKEYIKKYTFPKEKQTNMYNVSTSNYLPAPLVPTG